MKKDILPVFLDRLEAILPEPVFNLARVSFKSPSLLSIRINTLKIQTDQALRLLEEQGFSVERLSWCREALVLKGLTREELRPTNLFTEGLFYPQSLSSLLPVLVLNPLPGERVLDLCAAPGSKTTQMAALMQNQGAIVAVERVRGRFYKLKSVVELLGATNVTFTVLDARRFRLRNPEDAFDKILVDAPCSSEGRFKLADPDTYAYWSPRKIKEMVRKQRGILLNAAQLLKVGGVLVYSTCTFAPEENEGVVDWVLQKCAGAIKTDKIKLPGVKSYPALKEWQGKAYGKEVGKCFRVLPNNDMEGFFITKITRNY